MESSARAPPPTANGPKVPLTPGGQLRTIHYTRGALRVSHPPWNAESLRSQPVPFPSLVAPRSTNRRLLKLSAVRFSAFTQNLDRFRRVHTIRLSRRTASKLL